MIKNIKDTVLDKLDPKIMATVIIMGVIEFEFLTYTRQLVLYAGTDAWLSVLLGGLATSVNSYFLVRLAGRFPKENFFQYIGKVWGKPLAAFISLTYLLYWTVYLTMVLEGFAIANRVFFLPETPYIVPMFLIILGAVWIVPYGFTAVVRLLQLMLPILALPLLISFLFTVPSVQFDNYLPVMSNGIFPVIKGAIYYAGIFQGVLGIILFLSPFLTNIKKSFKPVLLGVNLVVFIGLIQTGTAIGVIGIENVKESIWPGIDTISSINFPGFPVERFELWLTIPWLAGVFSSACLFMYLIVFGFIQVFHMKSRRITAYIIAGITVLSTYLFPNYSWIMVIRMYFTYLTLIFLYLIPVTTYFLAIIRDKKGNL